MIYIVDLAAVLAVAAGSSRTLGAHVFRCGWPALYLGHVRPVWGGMRCQQPGAECAVMHVQELRGPTLPSGLPGKGEHSSRATKWHAAASIFAAVWAYMPLIGVSACSDEPPTAHGHFHAVGEGPGPASRAWVPSIHQYSTTMP
jgi:hypothetical protein